jgi:hypothetical protein
MDIYFHKTPSPNYQEFPPVVDLMINQALGDRPNADYGSWYAIVTTGDHAAKSVTIGGTSYVVYVDDGGETAYHQTGGHTIHLFEHPTAYSQPGTGVRWGVQDGRHDLKVIIDYFRQSNPKDDAGQPLKFANGANITTPLITDDLYLNAVNAGWEIDTGTVFTNTAFCVSLQNEPDCP